MEVQMVMQEFERIILQQTPKQFFFKKTGLQALHFRSEISRKRRWARKSQLLAVDLTAGRDGSAREVKVQLEACGEVARQLYNQYMMLDSQIYSLEFHIKDIESSIFTQGSSFCIRVTRDSLEKTLPYLQVASPGQLNVDQIVQFSIPSEQLRRESKCAVQLLQQIRNQEGKELTRFQIVVMDSKNYSRREFRMPSSEGGEIVLHMTLKIISLSAKGKEQPTAEMKQEVRKVGFRQNILTTCEDQRTPSLPAETSSPIQKSLERGMKTESDYASLSKRQVAPKEETADVKNDDIKFLSSSRQEKADKKEKQPPRNLCFPPLDFVEQSCTMAHSQSRYCREIQASLDNFHVLDRESQCLRVSGSVRKSRSDEAALFQSLRQMKDKFELLHQHEENLNNDELISEEMLQVRRKQLEQSQIRVNLHPLGEQSMELSVTDSIQMSDHYNSDFATALARPLLKISPCFSIQFHLSSEPKEDSHFLSARKRYQLAKPTTPIVEKDSSPRHKACLNHTVLNRDVEQETLKKFQYMKINKINHLAQAADEARNGNHFLIKANEQLKLSKRLAEQKLVISNDIIKAKDDLLNHGFEALKEQMRVISSKLSLKNEEAEQRELKINSFQLQIDQQTREVNGLKEELRMSNMRVKELKNLLALKEEGEEAGRKDTANLMEGFPKIAVAPTRLDVTTTLFHTSYSSEKMANSARKMFQRDSRVRKVSSIENEVNATQVEQSNDKSVDANSNKSFRKFSRSKNPSSGQIEPRPYRTPKHSQTDFIFSHLNELIMGSPKDRLLQNL